MRRKKKKSRKGENKIQKVQKVIEKGAEVEVETETETDAEEIEIGIGTGTEIEIEGIVVDRPDVDLDHETADDPEAVHQVISPKTVIVIVIVIGTEIGIKIEVIDTALDDQGVESAIVKEVPLLIILKKTPVKVHHGKRIITRKLNQQRPKMKYELSSVFCYVLPVSPP